MKNNEIIIWIIGGITAFLFLSGGFGMIGFGYGGMMSMMYGYGLYGLASIFQFAYSLLVMAALVLLVVWLWKKIQEKKING